MGCAITSGARKRVFCYKRTSSVSEAPTQTPPQRVFSKAAGSPIKAQDAGMPLLNGTKPNLLADNSSYMLMLAALRG